MHLDDDQLALALTALRHVANQLDIQSTSVRTDSGCDGAAKSCIDGYCLPKIRDLIAAIEEHEEDEANGD